MIRKYKIITLVFILILSLSACRNKSHRGNSETRRGNRERAEIPKTQREKSTNTQNSSVIKMRKSGGVYYVPCKINGTEMDFIFDTGASSICMSLTEAMFLYKHGKLKDKDIYDKQQYQTADGSIHEGMIVVLREVIIGDWKLQNVQATVVDNMDAPLLLGQSALAAFGKISIDYSKNEITFFE